VFERFGIEVGAQDIDAVEQGFSLDLLDLVLERQIMGRLRNPGSCPRQADRALVAGRGPCRPARHFDPRLGRTRQPATRAARSALPKADAEAMNLHLAEISRQVAPGAHAVLWADGAGWHRIGGKLKVPERHPPLGRHTGYSLMPLVS
jgi:hypothetical protein